VRLRVLKCWGVGAAISLVAVGCTVFGVHTPLELIGILFGLPLFIVTAEITKGGGGNLDYALMILFGSVFYGVISYLIWLVVRRVRSKKPATKI
jgi:hypothetical protein